MTLNTTSALASTSALFWPLARTSSERQFKMQHWLKHVAYDKAASKQGISLPAMDLTGALTPDWFARHATRHKTLRLIVGTGEQSPTVGLSSLDFDDRQQLQAWMQYHERLHADLDHYFGLA
jgi:hypothetical protein